MTLPRLYGTPLSHFTRKVRILLAELGVPFDLIFTPGVLATDPAAYADNPLMRVPALVHGDDTVFDSDHIARYLVARYDPGDRFGVRSESVRDLNRLAVTSGVMDNEVVLILAKRGGLEDIDGVVYFRKLAAAIEASLGWLDRETDPDDLRLDYADIAMICMWQHLAHYGLVSDLDRFARIAARVARFADRPSVASTTPATSLAAAAATGA